jgi:transcriptional regulator with XRE-family HTH domain
MASQKKYKNEGVDTEPVTFGSFLRQLREQNDLPLRAVAAAAGMDQAHLSKAELGQRLPTATQTEALARFFRQDPLEWEARRIAQKFHQDHSGNPAAVRAVLMLHTSRTAEDSASTAIPATPDKPRPPAGSGVTVLHAD